jgi:hypothetical protein
MVTGRNRNQLLIIDKTVTKVDDKTCLKGIKTYPKGIFVILLQEK